MKPAPPTRHELALMIWLCVFPTLTILNVTLGDWLAPMSTVLRTFVLATIAVPVAVSTTYAALYALALTGPDGRPRP